MEMILRTDLSTWDHVAEFRWSSRDQVRAHFDAADHQLLKECEASTSIADKLLALELIARRIEEQRKRDEKEKEDKRAALGLAILKS